jgi:hypothetical protein
MQASIAVGGQAVINGAFSILQTAELYVPAETAFAGTPGTPNCHGQSVSALTQQYGNINAAAKSLGYSSVQVLQDAITAFCAQAFEQCPHF